jgi:predicted phage terminase large subunit-like protein
VIVPQALGRDPNEVRRNIFRLREELLRRKRRELARKSIAYYIRRIWPWFILEEIHLLIAGYLEAIEEQLIDRLMIFLPPRAGKSRIASIILPSHYLGRFPGREVMQAGHSDELSRDFGRETKNLTATPEYQDVFPGFTLATDVRAAGRWRTTAGGGYFATGLTGGIAGKGFHLGSIDDPLSEQNARSKIEQKKAFAWYGSGFYTRQALDVSAIVATGTRWDKGDLFGQLLAKSNSDDEFADDWTVLKIPAVIDADTAEMLNEVSRDPQLITNQHPKRYKFKAGDSFAPRRYPLKKILRRKANLSTLDWEALYQQNPTVEEGAILKRSWWKKWTGEKPPKCHYVIQVYDTAFSEPDQKDNAFTARTTWGVFDREDREPNPDGISMPKSCVILLERYNKRAGFPELRKDAAQARKDFHPDRILIEKKASGHSLIQEFRGWKVPVLPVKVDTDKVSRAYASSGVLEHGFVYYLDRNWSEDVISQCAEFPTGEFSDLVDTCTMAWLYLRRRFHMRLAEDDDEEKNGVNLMKRRLYG